MTAGRSCLVTGADGFVGSRLVGRLVEEGARVRALVRRVLAGRDGSGPNVERVRGDVTEPESVAAAARGCELVFHCAWGGATLAEGRRINVDGTRSLVTAAAAAGVARIVHVSTMAVHGHHLPPLLTEDCPLIVTGDPYGVTKAEGERAAFELGRALGVEVVVLRPTLVYGPRAPLWVVSYFERTKHEQLALVDGGTGIANLVYVDDLVGAMLAAASRPGLAGEALLVSGADPIRWRDYIGYFARMCGKPLPPSVPRWRAWGEVQWLRVYGTLTQRPRRLVGMDLTEMTQRARVSIARAREQLGWEPRVTIDEGMRRCEAWLRAEGHLPPVETAETHTAPGVAPRQRARG